MENSGRRVMQRKVTPRPMSASANPYDRFACALRAASGRKRQLADHSSIEIHYPAAMIEVKNFADLPDGVQTLAIGSVMKERFSNTPTKFRVGGAGKSRAIVAYEQFGCVPSFFVSHASLAIRDGSPQSDGDLTQRLFACVI
jgi:hypothetical protein